MCHFPSQASSCQWRPEDKTLVASAVILAIAAIAMAVIFNQLHPLSHPQGMIWVYADAALGGATLLAAAVAAGIKIYKRPQKNVKNNQSHESQPPRLITPEERRQQRAALRRLFDPKTPDIDADKATLKSITAIDSFFDIINENLKPKHLMLLSSHCPNLQLLDCSLNRGEDFEIEEESFDKFRNLHELETLNLSQILPAKQSLKFLEGCRKLKKLILASSEKAEDYSDWESLKRLRQLQHLDLSGVKGAQERLRFLPDNLKSLKIRCVKLTSNDLNRIAVLELEALDLSFCNLTQDQFDTFTFPKTLQHLRIKGNVQLDPQRLLRKISGLKELVELDLSETSLTDLEVDYLTGLSNLAVLHLEGTALSDIGLSNSLVKITTLRKLNLKNAGSMRGQGITDEGMRTLKGLPHLEVLCVSELSHLKDPTLFKGFPALKILHAVCNHGDEIKRELQGTEVTVYSTPWNF